MEDKIDIHKKEKAYERVMRNLEADNALHSRDKELMLRFVWDCKMGKTHNGKCKKVVGKSRIIKYVQTLRFISKWVGKPFEEVTQEDMERLVCDIDENKYKNMGKNYTEETKADYKKTLRKFFKWLGKPNLVDFISLAVKMKDMPALRREEAEMLINSTPDPALKAAITVLFDGGVRIEELLNLRIKDVTIERYGSSNECPWIDVRYSKTFARKIPLPLSSQCLREWLTRHPDKFNLEAQVFPINYPTFLKRLRTLSLKSIGKKVTPHMLRHSSATYWAPKLNRYQLCAKYGWAFSSDMPDRYIKRKGIIFDEIAEKGDVDQTTRLQRENRQLREEMEKIGQDYQKVKKVLEVIMPVIDSLEADKLKEKILGARKQQMARPQQLEGWPAF
jgi:site-specific recombinase XerD